MEPTRIVVELEGTAVVLRTPLGRSVRFRSLGDARKWHDAQTSGVLPMLVAGGIASLLKVVLEMDAFLIALPVVLGIGMVASYVVSRRARPDLPEPTPLTWEESVRLDDRPHPLSRALQDLGAALASALLLALVGYLVLFEHGARNLEEEGIGAQLLTGAFVVGLALGLVLGVGSAVQRLRFHTTRARLDR